MTARQIALILALAIVVVLGARHARDPLRTPLPFGSTDLSEVQPQLARLPEDQRSLVEAYVKRSNGDVLTAQFADPDDPLTARTFAEAIELQRAWMARMAKDEVRMAKLRAERDAQLAPLRQMVDVRVIEATIVPSEQDPNFVIQIRIQNRSNQRVVALSGSLKARDRDEFLPLDLCWIELNQALAAGSSLEVECGRSSGGASAQQRAFVDNPPGRFSVEWEPRHIKLADGSELRAKL